VRIVSYFSHVFPVLFLEALEVHAPAGVFFFPFARLYELECLLHFFDVRLFRSENTEPERFGLSLLQIVVILHVRDDYVVAKAFSLEWT
jgi:hypothetical protein